MEDDQAIEIIKKKDLPEYTDQTITDPDKLMDEIRKVRSKGYATDYEEYLAGIRAVAAPITGNKKQPWAIYVVGFKASLNEEKMDILKREIKNAADTISSMVRLRMH